MERFHRASTVAQPVCERCGMRTVLSRITPDGRGFESRSFECPKCDHLFIERVPTDPMEQSKGYLSGELRPPK